MDIIKLNLALALVFLLPSFGQVNDSMYSKTTDELFDLYEKSEREDDKIVIMKKISFKAKKKKSREEIIMSYYILSGLYKDTRVLTYSDSIIDLSLNTPNKYYPALAYLTKAYFYQDKYDYKNAIDNYLLVNKYAKTTTNLDLVVLSNYSIGALKRKIKEYEGALILLKENLKYAHINNRKNHILISLIEISNIYTESKKNDSLKIYSQLGKELSLKLNDTITYHHFLINDAIADYHKGNYEKAIKNLDKEAVFFEEKNNKKYLIYPYFYLASAYKSKGNSQKSILYYKKVDSIFQLEKSISPFIRDTYKFLINYSKESNNLKNQLMYVNRLISFDSIINKNSFYLSEKIYKEYDIPKLKAEKRVIINAMKEKENSSFITIITLALILLIIFFLWLYQNKKRKFYKKRIEEIITTTTTTTTNNNNNNKEISVPKEIIKEVLSKLEHFEKERIYLSNTTTLNSLAKDFNTNTNYLSKIINHYKDLSFTNYLNTLRINFIITELKTNSLYRKFTIKGIAEEAGFNNSESFSKAFYKVTDVKPSYFLKQLTNHS